MAARAGKTCIAPGGVSLSGINAAEIEPLVHTLKPRLEALAGASLLFTGATGWFGTWLLDLLCAADHAHELGLRISAVSRDPAAFLGRYPGFAAHPAITWIKTDVRDLECTGAGFSHVIHAATDSSERSGSSTPRETFATIVDGTRRALAAAGNHCKSILMLSSGAVYGPAREGLRGFAEGHPGGPDPSLAGNAYAEGKRAAEQVCAIAADEGLPVRIARCFAFVGPHMPFDQHFAIGNFIADAVDGRPIRVRSDGRPLRSYLYMSDLMRALLSILVDGAVGRAYNVGSDVAVTIEELAQRVNRVAGGSGVLIEGAPSDPLDRYVPDVTRIRTELGFTGEVALDDAIARTASWRRAQLREPLRS
jgi:nucleoside-diphosphate-sugar epimerase